MKPIDKRVHYIIMVDTETCNAILTKDGKLDLSNSLVYDIGWAVVDKKGHIYETKSYIVEEIFYGLADVMKSAYYARKLPQYREDIASGKRIVSTLREIQKDFKKTMAKYNTNTITAHNARFDYNALNTTQRYITKSRYRYFFPYGTEVWDTMKMALDVVAKKPSYIAFCQRNGYMTKHKTPRPKVTAEVLFRYISGNEDFIESHTGLEDVDIERQVLAYCFKQHKRMRKELFKKLL